MHPTFTPSAMAPEELDAITVGRSSIFDTFVDRIRGAARDGSRPHTLLVAPRGAGKTHTVHVAVHRSLADPATAKSVLPVLIPEDSLAIGSYIDLLVEIARSIDDGLAAAARDMRRLKDTIGVEQAIDAAAGDRMILLTIENLDRVFDVLGAGGQGALRAWVETSTAIMIFATAPMLFTGVSSRSYPWYGSFIVESLPELTVDDAVAMLGKSARRNNDEPLATFIESRQGRERLHVVHRLAGGSPRLWHILSEGIDIASLDALVPAVESLLDRLAPYYQQQLWQLPAGEQRLVVELARGWEPRTVSDLATALGISNQSAAAALGRLSLWRWVTSAKADTGDRRASWYDLTEPLLRYHLQYREDRGKPLRLLVEFLRVFYSRERLLDELADAVPGSPVERHLQLALAGSLVSPAPTKTASSLIGGLRMWIAEAEPGIAEIATALEHVACAAAGQSCARTIPENRQKIVADATVATTAGGRSFDVRFKAGLDVLSTAEWDPASEDALLWVQSTWGVDDFRYQERLDRLVASRRGSEPAALLRGRWARNMLQTNAPGAAEAALTAFNQLLDDVADHPTSHSTQPGIWIFWSIAVIRTGGIHPRRAPDPLATAAGVLVAIKNNDVEWRDVGKILESIVPEDRDQVAARMVLMASSLDLNPPSEFDPLQHASDDFKALVDRLMRQLASESSAGQKDVNVAG